MLCIFDPRREECSRHPCAGAWSSAHTIPPLLGAWTPVPGAAPQHCEGCEGHPRGATALDWSPCGGGVLSATLLSGPARFPPCWGEAGSFPVITLTYLGYKQSLC